MATPLTADGELNEPVFRALLEALIPDLDGVFVLGSSGELTWLPDPVADRVVRVAVDQVAKRIPVYVGVGDTGLARTLDRADRLGGLGADILVAAAPFYYAVSSEARLVEHFVTIAERAPAPVLLYNIPQNTHRPLPPAVVRALADHERIVGIKDSAGDWIAFDEILGLRSEFFSVLQGREHMAAISLWSGADGLISAMGNFAPRLLQALAASIRNERPQAETLELQATVGRLAGVFTQGDWLAGLKSALMALGWEVGEPSAPIAPYTASQRRVVERLVASPDLVSWLTVAPAASPLRREGAA
jgi:4-hydroxy-tetrahydrodipicolinate synthase